LVRMIINMKVIVAYMSQTGNTRKVAEAIFEEIQSEKEHLCATLLSCRFRVTLTIDLLLAK